MVAHAERPALLLSPRPWPLPPAPVYRTVVHNGQGTSHSFGAYGIPHVPRPSRLRATASRRAKVLAKGIAAECPECWGRCRSITVPADSLARAPPGREGSSTNGSMMRGFRPCPAGPRRKARVARRTSIVSSLRRRATEEQASRSHPAPQQSADPGAAPPTQIWIFDSALSTVGVMYKCTLYVGRQPLGDHPHAIAF